MGKRHTHDMCNTRIYGIWNSMKSRCSGTKDKHHYKHYFGKGIRVCNEWKNDFLSFYNWAIENGYSDELELDRINNDGNYEPSNCQWITHKENNNKRGNNRIITAFGESHTLTEWADKYNMSVDTLASRLTRGWDIERALTEPIKNAGKRMRKTKKGEFTRMNKYFSFNPDVFDEEYLVCRLEEKINDGLLNYSNHIQDNGFFGDTLKEVVESMRERKYEPVGISLNPPFECAVSSSSIAFVIRVNEEIYWLHMPETYWFHLLADYYGRKHADMIISEVKGRELNEQNN